MHGIDPERGLVMVKAREGEAYLRHEDILDAIARHGQQTAVVCFGGVHFLTGETTYIALLINYADKYLRLKGNCRW